MSTKAIIKGTCIALVLFALAVFAGGWWVLAVWQTEMYLASYLVLAKVFALFFGGVGSGFMAGKFPWRHGALVGFFYAIMLTAVGWILLPGLGNNEEFFNSLVLSILLGSIGGVVGKNLRGAANRRKSTI